MKTILGANGTRVPLTDTTAVTLLVASWHHPPPFTDLPLPDDIKQQALDSIKRDYAARGVPFTEENLKVFMELSWRAISDEFKVYWVNTLLRVTAKPKKMIQ